MVKQPNDQPTSVIFLIPNASITLAKSKPCPKKQREFITDYVTEVMVQRAVEEKEHHWIVEQSLKTPYYIAANLFSAGMFSDYRKEAKLASTSVPTLTVIAEHWATVAKSFTESHSPGSSIEVLGGHMMFWEHDEKFNQVVEQFLFKKV